MKNLIQKASLLLLAMVTLQAILPAQIVTIYSESNYGGRSRVFSTPGNYTISDWNVKSIRITEGYVVKMANEGGCTGICTYWRSEQGSGTTTLGPRGCTITIIRSNANNARLTIQVSTGGDDLRGGSSVNFKARINGVGIRSNRAYTGGIGNGQSRTLPLNISGFHPHQILDFILSYRSGSSGIPFETTDNWNVNAILISYTSDSFREPIIMWRGSGNPLVRFTDQNREYSVPSYGNRCN